MAADQLIQIKYSASQHPNAKNATLQSTGEFDVVQLTGKALGWAFEVLRQYVKRTAHLLSKLKALAIGDTRSAEIGDG